MNLSEALQKVVEGISLSFEEARSAMTEIMEGGCTPSQIAAYITALRMKGETVEEIAGSAESMRSHATPVPVGIAGLVDTCGTGGDGSQTINISTLSALIAAGAGVPVAKHGNRSVSSRSGSADVLSALGVNIQVSPETMAECIREAGVGFLFAPLLHGAMKHAIGPRREIGIRTIFNILGPLCNPAGATRQVLGVFHPDLTSVLANVLKGLGSVHVWVVHGSGMDEITLSGSTRVSELKNGEVRTYDIHPKEVGLEEVAAEALRGGDPAENAQILREVLAGRRGPYRDVGVFNAGAAILVGGKAGTLVEGVRIAENSLDSGQAARTLAKLVEVSNREKAGATS